MTERKADIEEIKKRWERFNGRYTERDTTHSWLNALSDFAIRSHADIPALIADLEALEAEVERLVVAVKHIEDMSVPDEFLSDEERLKHIVKLAQAALEEAE